LLFEKLAKPVRFNIPAKTESSDFTSMAEETKSAYQWLAPLGLMNVGFRIFCLIRGNPLVRLKCFTTKSKTARI
jgi:hypothetical protein